MTKSHVRMCTKNPKRPAAPKASSPPSVAAPQITVKEAPVAEQQLPTFEGSKQEAAQAPAGAEAPPVFTAGMIVAPIVKQLCDQFEKRLTQDPVQKPTTPQLPAPFTPDERELLAQTYGALAEKYIPAALLAKYGFEASALLLTVTIVLPKILEYRAYWNWRKEQAKKQREDEAPPVTGFRFAPPNEPAAQEFRVMDPVVPRP